MSALADIVFFGMEEGSQGFDLGCLCFTERGVGQAGLGDDLGIGFIRVHLRQIVVACIESRIFSLQMGISVCWHRQDAMLV